MSIPAETPAAVIILPSSTTRWERGCGAELAQFFSRSPCPTRGRGPSPEQPGRAEDQCTSADRRGPLRSRAYLPDLFEYVRFLADLRLAPAARHQ